jgi:DNA-binding NarL/FixJ family response regulator
MIRLYIIEDHLTFIVSSFRFLFRPQRDGISVTGSSSFVDEVVKEADPNSFDIFILDLHIPDHRPLDNIRKLKARFPDKPIVVFTQDKSSSWKTKMIQEGAMAYITKDASREELKLALQKVSAGDIFNPSFTNLSAAIKIEVSDDGDPLKMTPLQIEIIKHLSEGLVHKQISDKTGVSRSLVEKILKDFRQVCHVKNNVELINLLTKTGRI